MDLSTLRLHQICPGLFALVFAGALWSAPCAAGTRVVFGTLQAYTNLSDGPADVSPAEAFRIAKEAGGLDFLSLSDHAAMLSAEEMRQLRVAAMEATEAGFVGLYGQSCSSVDGQGNSTTIHNYPMVVPQGIRGQYRRLFEQLLPDFVVREPDHVVVAGLNHPRDLPSDYGLATEFSGEWASMVATLDPFVQLIPLSTGPTDASLPGFVPDEAHRFMHRDASVETWFDYLSHGMHLAPQIDHGTHSATYGFRIDGRTAVWVEGEFTAQSLLDALAQRHCYATEDRNLHILAFVGDGQLPGDIIHRPSDGMIRVTLHIHDPDEPEATYSIEVLSGHVRSGRRPRPQPKTYRVSRGGDVGIEFPGEPGEYFVIHVLQDSPDSPCAQPDDAWLAPIWVEERSGDDSKNDAWAFVGRRSEGVYHRPDCDRMANIRGTQLEHYAVAPDGQRAHQACTTDP